MRGGEKSFEILSSNEKEAFELCSEILLWSSDPHILTWPGVLQLREDATRLHEFVSSIDMEYDDRYYKAHAALDQLKRRYEELRMMMHARRQIYKEFEPDKDDIEGLLGAVREHIRTQSSACLILHQHNHRRGYGDNIEIRIFEDTKIKGAYFVDIEEIFDYVGYTNPYRDVMYEVLEKYFRKRMIEMAKIGEHLHDFGGMQYSTIFKGVTPQEVSEIVREVLQVVQANPRQIKAKKQ